MKINHKLILSFLLVASLASVTTFFTLKSYKKIHGTFVELMDDSTRTLKILNDLKQAGEKIVSSTTEIGFIHSETAGLATDAIRREEQQLSDSGYQAFESSIKDYEGMVTTVVPGDAKTLDKIRVAGGDLIRLSKEIVDLKKRNIRGDGVMTKREEFENAEQVFLTDINVALAEQSAEQVSEQENVEASITLATRQTSVVTILTFMLAIFSGCYISFLISRRIKRLKEASQKVGDGELNTHIEVNSHDEVSDLSRSFNKMIDKLRDSRVENENQRERLHTIVSNVQGIVWETKTAFVDGETLLRFDFVSDYMETMLGYRTEECLADPGFWLDIVHPDDRERTKRKVGGIFASGRGGTLEFRWIAKDGREVWIESRNEVILDGDSKTIGLRGIAVDITERKLLEQKLTHQAMHDPLTNLPNRALFRDRVEHAIQRMARKRSPIAVLFLDIDNFKSVNDSLGHAAGDELLCSVTERFRACLRPSDTPARLGGDEFAVLVEDLEHADEATAIAERLRIVLNAPFSIAGTEIFVSSSIGIVVSDNKDTTPEELLRNADVAMYRSKNNGKDRLTLFATEMHDTLVNRLRLEADMRHGIEERQFELHYQPIVDLKSGEVMGMEALVRWNHPEQGLIPPLDFIPLAEDTGLIVPLGRWILEEACRQTRKWQTQYRYGKDLSITVNIAGRQFQEDGLLETVKHTLAASGLPPHSLVLEITESTMLANTELTIIKLGEFKKLGIRFAIDDFGTGYSSLSYLQRLPVDILKIDKSFIDRIALDKEGAAVAKAIITMSDTLHLKTIAEGIEDGDQQMELEALGCELGQGYFFAKPLPANDMARFLSVSVLAQGRGFLPPQICVTQAAHK